MKAGDASALHDPTPEKLDLLWRSLTSALQTPEANVSIERCSRKQGSIAREGDLTPAKNRFLLIVHPRIENYLTSEMLDEGTELC